MVSLYVNAGRVQVARNFEACGEALVKKISKLWVITLQEKKANLLGFTGVGSGRGC